jgi:hypothetical protein
MTEGKSFQQITEEFAEIVIAKFCIGEGRKISKVTEKMASHRRRSAGCCATLTC